MSNLPLTTEKRSKSELIQSLLKVEIGLDGVDAGPQLRIVRRRQMLQNRGGLIELSARLQLEGEVKPRLQLRGDVAAVGLTLPLPDADSDAHGRERQPHDDQGRGHRLAAHPAHDSLRRRGRPRERIGSPRWYRPRSSASSPSARVPSLRRFLQALETDGLEIARHSRD